MLQPKIAMTFDDGNDNVYTNAYPIMKKYGLVGTAFPYTSAIGNTNRVTYPQLQTMQSNGWEIGSHTHNNVKVDEVTIEEARFELSESKRLLETNNINCVSFAPPSRGWDDSLVTIADEEGYEAVRAVTNTSNYTQSYPIPNKLFVKEGSPSLSTANYPFEIVKGWIDKAIDDNSLLILLFHHVRDVDDLYSTYISDFEAICSYISLRQKENKVSVEKFNQAVLESEIQYQANVERVLIAERNIPSERNLISH